MKQQLSEKAVRVWRMRTLLIFFLVMFLCGGILVFSIFTAVCIAVLSIPGCLFTLFIAIPYVYKNTVLEIRDDGITITKGVFIKKRMNILAEKIQYVEFLQSPLQRYYNVYTAALHTAGTTVFISQIDNSVGKILRNYKKEM